MKYFYKTKIRKFLYVYVQKYFFIFKNITIMRQSEVLSDRLQADKNCTEIINSTSKVDDRNNNNNNVNYI